MSAFGALFGHHDTVSGMSYHEVITDTEMQAATSAWGQSRPNWAIRATSAFPSIATGPRTLREVRKVPISEVASLAESRPLVEFQIASVCEKNRKVCGQRLIQSIDPGSSRHRHREQSFLRVSQGADLLSIYPHTCGPAVNHTKLAGGRGADINNAPSTIRAAIVYPHGYRRPVAHVGH